MWCCSGSRDLPRQYAALYFISNWYTVHVPIAVIRHPPNNELSRIYLLINIKVAQLRKIDVLP